MVIAAISALAGIWIGWFVLSTFIETINDMKKTEQRRQLASNPPKPEGL